MSKKVLIADDEKELVDFLRGALVREGFDVVVASDGQEAKDRITEEEPDLILLDLIMPRVAGWEVLKWLREEKRSKIPTIIVSAKDQMDDIKKGYALEANYYIIKPVRIKDIVSGIRTILALPPEEETHEA